MRIRLLASLALENARRTVRLAAWVPTLLAIMGGVDPAKAILNSRGGLRYRAHRAEADLAIASAEVSRLTAQRYDDRALAAQLADWLESQRGWTDISLYVRMLRRMAAGGGR